MDRIDLTIKRDLQDCDVDITERPFNIIVVKVNSYEYNPIELKALWYYILNHADVIYDEFDDIHTFAFEIDNFIIIWKDSYREIFR